MCRICLHEPGIVGITDEDLFDSNFRDRVLPFRDARAEDVDSLLTQLGAGTGRSSAGQGGIGKLARSKSWRSQPLSSKL